MVKLGLFDGYGIELEYMIADRKTLKVRPIADLLLTDKAGELTTDIENGDIDWSNELTAHLIELKCHEPVVDLTGLEKAFTNNIQEMNTLLERHGAMLLPTASHPTIEDGTETLAA